MTLAVVTDADLAHGADVLRRGGLVAFPTETVYGLGADATNPVALRRLFTVKGRPPDHPVIVHLADAAELDAWAIDVAPVARALAAACWPGPLTLVLRRAPGVPDEVTGGRDTVGVRVPAHPVARGLLDAFGGGVAAPSANRFGRVSPTTADHVRRDLGDDVDVVLDGGACEVGIESTVVDCGHGEPVIRRVGAVPAARLAEVLGGPLATSDEVGGAPGTLEAHYAPRARVVVTPDVTVLVDQVAAETARGRRVGVLAVDPPSRLAPSAVVLGAPADVDELAHTLYARLREADARGMDVVVALCPPDDGLGAAVADRLRRAGNRSADA